MKKLITAFITAAIFLMMAISAFADDSFGVYYRNARVFGKIITYDPDRDVSIVYGSIYAGEPGGSWRLVESRKFHLLQPVYPDVREKLSVGTGKTILAEGNLVVWPGQKEEVLLARNISYQNYRIGTPAWFAFGKTVRTEQIYKFNMDSVTDVVDVLAGIALKADIPQDKRLAQNETAVVAGRIASPGPDDRIFSSEVKSEFNRRWNYKWCVVKDQGAANDLRKGVGGWQFYQGLLGQNNCYIESAPVIRKDLNAFMDAVRPGGGTPEEEGPAVMCAYVHVTRDRYGNIVNVTASGALYDTIPGLLTALKNPENLNLETWRLEGWTEEGAEQMDGKLCWLSGARVLVYDEKGNLVDQYFGMRNFLTRNGFDNILDVGNYLIGQGGI